MTGSERRQKLLKRIKESSDPISSAVLCKEIEVSRQTIAQDIAMLRSLGNDIQATSKGYFLQKNPEYIRLFKVYHDETQIKKELNLIVDLGGTVLDVIVNHKIYGKISVPLNIKSRRDVRIFLNSLENGISSPLSNITAGYHFHHISADLVEILDEIEDVLSQNSFLAEVLPFEKDII